MAIKCQNCGLQMGGASRIYRDGSILDRCFRCGFEQPTAPQVITAGTESQPASKVFLEMIRFVTRNCAEMGIAGWEISLRHAHKWSLDEVDEFIGWAADTNLWRTVQVNLHGRGKGVGTSDAPSNVVDTPVVNSKDLSSKRDVLLDQLSKEQDPTKKEQLKNRLRSLARLVRTAFDPRIIGVADLQAAVEALGIEVCHHENDLYFPVTAETESVVNRYIRRKQVSIFKDNLTGKPWYDAPSAYSKLTIENYAAFVKGLSPNKLQELSDLAVELYGSSYNELRAGECQADVASSYKEGRRARGGSYLKHVTPEVDVSKAPSSVDEFLDKNTEILEKSRDALLDQFFKEQDPEKKEQLKYRLKSLSVKRWATIKGCLAGLVPVYADNLGDLEVAHETLKYIFERELRVTAELEFMPEDGEKGDDAVALSFEAMMNLLKLIVPACVRYAMDTQDSKPLVEVGKLVGVLKQYAAEHRKSMNQGDQDYQGIEHTHSYAPGNASQQQGTWG